MKRQRQEQSGMLEELEAVLGGLSRRCVVGVMEGLPRRPEHIPGA